MRLAINVVAYEPEVTIGRIEPERLRADGWSEAVVQQLQRSRQTNSDLVAEQSPKAR
jgi:hypothetical protein